MRLYPINLNLKGKKCVVIGGGKVAERKVKSLLACQANIWVASLKLTKGLKKLLSQAKINHLRENYQPQVLKEACLVIAATNSAEINSRISQDAIKLNKLINVVDSPRKCNFFVPAVLRRGSLTISISTNGKSPALARKIKQELKGLYGSEYTRLLKLLAELRPEIKARYNCSSRRKMIWQKLINSDILDLLKKGKIKLIKSRIKKWKS